MAIYHSTYQILGLSLRFLEDGAFRYNLVLAQLTNNQVEILKSWDSTNDVDDLDLLLAEQSPGIPIALNLRGAKIMTRTIANELTDFETQFSGDDFWIDRLESGKTICSAVIRKDVIHKFLDRFSKAKHPVIGLSLDEFSLAALAPYLETLPLQIGFLYFSDQEPQELRYLESEKPYSEVLGVEAKNLASFAAVLKVLTGQNSLPDRVRLSRDEFQASKKIKQILLRFGSIVLLLLLANYFVFEQYYQLNSKNQQFVTLNQSAIKAHANLQAIFRERREYVNLNQLDKSSKFSFYADEIARLLPNGITLTQLNVFPLNKNRRTGAFTINDQLIQISGFLKENNLFKTWTEALNRCAWVKQINVQQFDEDKLNQQITFSISILLHKPE